MVRKKLAMAILALSALQANFASALGLGNLSIKSALNQPLNAEIKLLDTGDLDPTQVKIQLAAQEDFQRSGVDRDYFLTNLRFSVDMDGHGGGTIHITTKEPVVEPYLNFVIEARWPSGRLLREFAVLLDPPMFSANKGAGAVAPAASSAGQPAKRAAVQPPTVSTETQATKTIPDADMSLPATGKSSEYRVQVYDTLSKIAARYKPASDVSVAQTMLAIQRANPQAFINNNINLIKSGAVVRLPNADEARTLSAEQAAQDAEDQTHAWRSGATRATGTGSPAAGPQLDASAPEPSKAEGGYREKARLSIAAPGGSEKASVGEGTGAAGKGVEALRGQLTASQEALEKGKRDNRELQSRLDDMERQIATLQRLISLKDDQLAALQTKPAADKSAAAKPAEPVAAAQPSAAPTPAPAPVAEAPTPTAAPESTAPLPVPTPAAEKPAPAPKPAPQPSLLDQFTSNPLYLAGGAAALLLAVGGVILRRRKQAEEQESDSDFTFDDSDDTFQFGAAADDTLINDDGAAPAVADQPDESVEPAPAVEEAKKTVRPETGDAIAESDIYIAYGRYQQAVDLLSTAIDAEPARSDLRVKLLEVYVEMRNKEAFRQQFVALQGLGDSSAVAQVKDMLSSVDGVSDWLDDLSNSSSSFAARGTAVGVAAATVTATALVADKLIDMPEEAAAASADELDLDFDDVLDSAPLEEASLLKDSDFDLPTDTADNGDLEFNLDLDSDTTATSAQELSDLTLDFDNAPPSAEPVQSFDFNSAAEDEGLELDLGGDDLDQMLGELGETGALSDLEDLSAAAPSTNFPSQPAPVELDLSEEFDLGSAGEDLANSDVGEIDVFAGLDQPAPAADFNTAFTPSPEPVTEPVFEPAPASPQALDGDDFDFLSDSDEVATKLDLARAYIDMGDTDGARDILDEVLQEGTDNQKEEASTLLSRIG